MSDLTDFTMLMITIEEHENMPTPSSDKETGSPEETENSADT